VERRGRARSNRGASATPSPSWQAAAGVPPRAGGGTERGVPDVAADADPATGYQVLVDGQRLVIRGTSAVAPPPSSIGDSASYAPLGVHRLVR